MSLHDYWTPELTTNTSVGLKRSGMHFVPAADVAIGDIISTGGPSSYYDFPVGAQTLNDLMEYKAYGSWGADSIHLKDIMKAAYRWGEKSGTTKDYDARKIMYYAARLLLHYGGTDAVREALTKMLNDPQFKHKGA